MSAWLLLMVILTYVPGIQHNTVLNRFETYDECQKERNRVGFDMAEAYPYDLSFRIECQAMNPVSTQVNYTEILRNWADTRHPGFSYTLKVNKVKRLEVPTDDKNAAKNSMIFQIILTYVNGESQAYVVFVREEDMTVYAWVEVEVPEEDDPAEEEFPAKKEA